MKKNKIDLTKEPELFIDGEKVKFHYSRKERLEKIPKKANNNNFFDKGNRFIHIIILDIIFIMIIAFIFSVVIGRSKSVNDRGFKYYLTKKSFSSDQDLYFRLQIKNVSKKDKLLKLSDIELQILDLDNEIIFIKRLNIAKQKFKPKEYYTKNVIFEKPDPGKYKAMVLINIEKDKKIELFFSIK